MDAGTLLPLVNSAVITLGFGFVAVNQIKGNQNDMSRGTIQLFKDNIAAKDIEIAQMKASHDAAIASLKSELSALSAQLDNLKQANLVLQNTVTGKDTLTTIVEIMKPIPSLFIPGGFIEEVRVNQQKTLKDLAEIRAALEAAPTLATPKHEKFVSRSPLHPKKPSQS